MTDQDREAQRIALHAVLAVVCDSVPAGLALSCLAGTYGAIIARVAAIDPALAQSHVAVLHEVIVGEIAKASFPEVQGHA